MEDKVPICVWIYLWAFCFVPLIYISVFVPEATNSRIMEAEDRISEVEDRMVEINELERCLLFSKCLIEFTCDAVWSWTFLCWEFLKY